MGGTAYLSGDGAGGYQEDEKFAEVGSELTHASASSTRPTRSPSRIAVPGCPSVDALDELRGGGNTALLA